jgi:hypothetical protein
MDNHTLRFCFRSFFLNLVAGEGVGYTGIRLSVRPSIDGMVSGL